MHAHHPAATAAAGAQVGPPVPRMDAVDAAAVGQGGRAQEEGAGGGVKDAEGGADAWGGRKKMVRRKERGLGSLANRAVSLSLKSFLARTCDQQAAHRGQGGDVASKGEGGQH